MPMTIAPIGVTNPAAGVMATSPATAPVQAPRTVPLPLCSHSIIIQANAATAAAVLVLTNAATADVVRRRVHCRH